MSFELSDLALSCDTWLLLPAVDFVVKSTPRVLVLFVPTCTPGLAPLDLHLEFSSVAFLRCGYSFL